MHVSAGLLWLFLINKRNSRQFDLLDLSTLTVLSLLPIYHRFYDAALLIFALAWSLTALRGRLNVIAKAVLALIIAVFLVPGGSALEQFQRSGHFGGLKNYWWWNEFVLPHESWSVLLLSLLLLSAMYLNSSVESGR